MQEPDVPPVDESARRRFEAHRLGGGSDPISDFLPDPASSGHAATLEELVCIDLEARFRAWRENEEPVSEEPTLDLYEALLVQLDDEARSRIEREIAYLRRRFAPGLDVRAGERLGRYVLRERVGRGAFAEVWRATDPELRRDVAVKVPRDGAARDDETVERVLREARSAAQLHHPGIVPIFEVAREGGLPFIVSELVVGPTLAAEAAHRSLATDEAAAIVASLAEALEYAHACGVVHRDVKPGNVLLRHGTTPLLADFGLAYLGETETEGDGDSAGSVAGTPGYMAPEQARGDDEAVDARSDVHGLGAILFELLAGRAPYVGPTPESIMLATAHGRAPTLDTLAPGVPADLRAICERALAREPARRYASAGDLRIDLRRFLARRPVHARPLGPFGRLLLFARRSPVSAAAVAVCLLVVAGVTWAAAGRVLQERDRYREQRDLAQARLHDSLLNEAEARIRGRDSGWYGDAMDALRRAAALPGRDVRRLRDLVLRAHATRGASFEPHASWLPESGGVRRIEADPEGRSVALLTADGEVVLRDAESGEVLARRAPASAPGALAFHPSGALVAIGGEDGVVRLLDARTLADRGSPMASEGAVAALAFTPDGDALAIGGAGAEIVVAGVSAEGLSTAPRSRVSGHAGGVTCLAFAPDGDELATGGRDGVVRVLSWPGGVEERAIRLLSTPRGVSWAPDGTLALHAHETFGFSLAPPGSGERQRPPRLLHSSAVRRVVFDPQGNPVSASADGTLRSHDRSFRPLAVAADDELGAIVAMCALPERARYVVAHDGGALRVWDLLEPPARRWFRTEHVARFVPGTRRLFAVPDVLDLDDLRHPVATDYAPAPVGALGVGSSGEVVLVRRDGTIEAVPGGRLHAAPPTAGGETVCVSVTPEGRRAARADDAGQIELFDLAETTSAVWTVGAGAGVVERLHIEPDGRGLAVLCSEAAMWIESGAEPVPLSTVAGRASALAVASQLLALADTGGSIALLELPGLRRVGVLELGGEAAVALAFSGDGASLAAVLPDGRVHVFDIASGDRRELAAASVPAGSPLVFSSCARYLVHGAHVWDLQIGRAVARFAVARAEAAAWSHDGETCLVAGPGGSVASWSRSALEQVEGEDARVEPLQPTATVVLGGHRGQVWGVATSPDGRLVVTSGHWGDVVLRDAVSLAPLRALETAGEISWDAAFDPSSRIVAAGVGSRVHRWDVESGRELSTLRGHEGLVLSVAFDARGAAIVSSARDRTVRLWDAVTGEPRGELDCGGRRVHDLAYDAVGGRLAGACGDGAVLVWDRIVPGATPSVLEGHRSEAWAVAFAPDGELLASASQAGRILLRDGGLAPVAEIAAETRVLRSLSFSDDGALLAVAAWLQPSAVWDLDALRGELREMDLDW